MKVKTSITLSQSLLVHIDRLAGRAGSRSAVIERAVQEFVQRRIRRAAEARELAALNRHASALNAEAADVLGYQAGLSEE